MEKMSNLPFQYLRLRSNFGWTFKGGIGLLTVTANNTLYHKPQISLSYFRMKSTYSYKKVNLVKPLFIKAEDFGERTAIVDCHGTHTYEEILYHSNKLCDIILNISGKKPHKSMSQHVAFLCPNDVSYTVAKMGTWMSGGTAVPLCKTHPVNELEYFIEDSQSKILIGTEEFSEVIQQIANKQKIASVILKKEDYINNYENSSGGSDESDTEADKQNQTWLDRNDYHKNLVQGNQFKHKSAIIIYTSGTTGRPKGVVHTFGSLHANIDDMVKAWEWNSQDVILHALPLHHVHGVVNCLMTPLNCGATVMMVPKFDPKTVWCKLVSPVTADVPRSVNVFMAVPTMYAKLIEHLEHRFNRGRKTKRVRDFVKAVCSTKIRLMVSGSAALPQPIMDKWEDLTGHKLLERYGMTEIGMALTNPLHGNRIPGAVGKPFPQVEVCIGKTNPSNEKGYDVVAHGHFRRTKVTPGMEKESGELFVRGPNLFKEYWQRPEATKETFTKDGWFKTGDTASVANGVFSIMGRTSVDIIKSGGYKLSALDIERHLLAHRSIVDIAVVGLPDMTWGQKVAAVIVLKPGSNLDLQSLKTWAEDKLPSYQVPTVLKFLETMPRNAMGKVNKKELMNICFAKEMKQTM